MALRHDPAALVLISGFASLPFVVADIRPFIPKQLVRDRYENEAKVGRVKSPILVIQGEADGLVRPANAVRLAKAAPEAKVITVPDVGHELAYGPTSQQVTLDWLNKKYRSVAQERP